MDPQEQLLADALETDQRSDDEVVINAPPVLQARLSRAYVHNTLFHLSPASDSLSDDWFSRIRLFPISTYDELIKIIKY